MRFDPNPQHPQHDDAHDLTEIMGLDFDLSAYMADFDDPILALMAYEPDSQDLL